MTEGKIARTEFANDAFYSAFNARNFKQMSSLWANSNNCTCMHPGWQPLIDREDVLNSWHQIFINQPDDFFVKHHVIKTNVLGGVFSVLCFEELGEAWMVATNNYLFENDEPKIVHHQASPCRPPKDITLSKPSIQ